MKTERKKGERRLTEDLPGAAFLTHGPRFFYCFKVLEWTTINRHTPAQVQGIMWARMLLSSLG